MPGELEKETSQVPLNYASPDTPKPDATARLIIGLLIAFLALGAAFLAIVIYTSWID